MLNSNQTQQIRAMSKNIHIKQWKASGRREPCCKMDDGAYGFKKRNRKLRHLVKHKLNRMKEVI